MRPDAPLIHRDLDVAVVGAGFAGSLTALALRRRGFRVALVERARHPRFAIGESSTPLANLLIEELADAYDLPCVRTFAKWGTWQQDHPDVAAGLKRGFTFYFHQPGRPFADDRTHQRQLLVAASPHDGIGDTHWYRPDFDAWLAREAESAGALYLDETRLDGMHDDESRVVLDGDRRGQPVHLAATFLIDASGPRGFLHRTLGLAEAPLRWLPAIEGLYTHFAGVAPWGVPSPDNETPPFPVDAAAVHHVFDGGWMWILRFNNGITSAGAALTGAARARLGPDQDALTGSGSVRLQPDQDALERAWRHLLATLPSVRDQFVGARQVHPFVHAPRLAFRSRQMVGPRWAMLPSAAGVIDPLLSTGFPLTLLGIGRLLGVLERTSGGVERRDALRAYAQVTQAELDATERLVAALYAAMDDPPLFKRLTLLYFAASSYSEAARRLGRPELAPGFLLHAHERFGIELGACSEAAMTLRDDDARSALFERINRAIEPFDVAGLLDPQRRDWYPVVADDLVRGAPKLHARSADVHRLLERCGFAAPAARRSAPRSPHS